MSVQRFKSLYFRSTLLQKQIDQENQRRWPDWMRLLKLKKLRLMIKDSLIRLVQRYPDVALEAAYITPQRPLKRQLRHGKKQIIEYIG